MRALQMYMCLHMSCRDMAPLMVNGACDARSHLGSNTQMTLVIAPLNSILIAIFLAYCPVVAAIHLPEPLAQLQRRVAHRDSWSNYLHRRSVLDENKITPVEDIA